MAKQLLASYRIGGDVIDQVDRDSIARDQCAPAPEKILSFPPNSGTGIPVPESPPVGGSGIEQPGAEHALPPLPALVDRMKVEKDGIHTVFTLGDTQYRVSGVKALFVTSLRVNIRATAGGVSHYDSLDLYMAKARSGFAQALNRAWGAEIARVEKDLIQILEHFEEERDERLRSGSPKPALRMSAEDRELGMELLTDPRLFTRIVQDLSALGYVGEDLNKELLYLCASSRKMADPLSVLILSQSAAGKSYLVDCVKRLMPSEDVVAVTSLSDQALNYIDDLKHKFLILGEAVHGEVVEHQIREMLSGKELSRLVTIKDPETGSMRSTIVRTPVIVSSVMSSTSHAINPENASRCFVINADESKAQTERIHVHQREKYSLKEARSGSHERERIIRTHVAAQRLLTSRTIVNDFAPFLDFPTGLMRLRRDHDRFLDLIASVCFLRQYQKKIQCDGALEYIACDLEDYQIAYRIMVDDVLVSTLRELPKGTVMLYDEIRSWVKQEAARHTLALHEVSFTQRQVREMTGLAHTSVKYGLRHLVEYEYLVLARGGGERSKAFYRLKDASSPQCVDLSMIPSPDVMASRMQDGRR